MASQAIEICRQEGDEFRSVRLTIEDDGAIKMDAQDIGPTVAQIWDEDEYEFWVRVRRLRYQACLRTVAREVLGSVGRSRCVPGLVQGTRHPARIQFLGLRSTVCHGN